MKRDAVKQQKRLLVLHGPSLNLLGEREPTIYGTLTLSQLNTKLRVFARQRGCILVIHQSNSEGALIDYLQAYRKKVSGIVFNPGAYTHYSYALRDAVASLAIPVVEVHLTDLSKRETFRQQSVISPVCVAQKMGCGWESYTQAIALLLA